MYYDSNKEKQDRWAYDIDRFYKWKELYSKASTEYSKNLCSEQLRKIKEKYPQHLKNEVW